jgi:hypothetical protein
MSTKCNLLTGKHRDYREGIFTYNHLKKKFGKGAFSPLPFVSLFSEVLQSKLV